MQRAACRRAASAACGHELSINFNDLAPKVAMPGSADTIKRPSARPSRWMIAPQHGPERGRQRAGRGRRCWQQLASVGSPGKSPARLRRPGDRPASQELKMMARAKDRGDGQASSQRSLLDDARGWRARRDGPVRPEACRSKRSAGDRRCSELLNRCRASAAPLPSASSLAAAMSRRIGAMPQLVEATTRSFGTCLSTASMVAATSSGVSISSVATSITPIATSLPLSSDSSSIGTLALRHSTDTWSNPARRQRGENLLVLPPLAAERRLPVDVGLDAVAVADVHRGRAFEAVDRAVQRLDAPGRNLFHVDVEGRLVELDDVDAVLLQRARFGVEQIGEGERHLHPVAVVRVGDGVDDGHRPRHGDLELLRRCARGRSAPRRRARGP